MTIKKREILQLDGLRGISAIWVVLFHYLFFLNISKNLNLGFFQSIIGKGYLGVDVFFILSGYIISYNYIFIFQTKTICQVYLNFLTKRIARIYPSYALALFTLLIFYFLNRLKPYAANFAVYDIKNFIFSLLMIQSWILKYCSWTWNLPGWSVSVEWFLYLIYPLIAITWNRLKSVFFDIVIVLLAYFLLFILIKYFNQFFIMQAMEFGIIRGLLEFLIGCAIFSIINKLFATLVNSKISFDFIALVSFLGILLSTHFNLNNFFTIILFGSLIFSLSLSKGYIKIIFSLQPMKFLGRISYTIYILQFPYQILSNNIFNHPIASFYDSLDIIIYFSQVIVLILIATIIYYGFEEPLRKKINRCAAYNSLNILTKLLATIFHQK